MLSHDCPAVARAHVRRPHAAWALALSMMLLSSLSLGCSITSEMRYGPPGGGANGSFTGCAGEACDDDEGLAHEIAGSGFVPCEEGETRVCLFVMGEHEGVQSCFEGVQICVEGVWGPCREGEAS